jgi:hypothetical protein
MDQAGKKIICTDMTGALLNRCSIGGIAMTGIAYIANGTWANHLATTAQSEQRVYFLDLDANVQGIIATDSFTERPLSVSVIESSSSGSDDDHLVLVSNKDQCGGSTGNVLIVDQTGTLQKLINVSSFSLEPYAVVHVPDADKLMVADKSGMIYLIDFDANILDQNDVSTFGITAPQGIEINPLTCDHVINSKTDASIKYLNMP